MKLGFSNIAWSTENDDAVGRFLERRGISSIDIALSKYFPDIHQTTSADMQRLIDFWAQYGISIYGIQSLLFGTDGLNLFASDESRQAMIDHLKRVIELSSQLGARRLVFGSPKNRDASGIEKETADRIATGFFQNLAKILEGTDIVVCLEPNPTIYHCNYLIDAASTYELVKKVDRSSIGMQADFGAMLANGEDCEEVFRNYGDAIRYCHISEPYLTAMNPEHLDAHRKYAEVISNQYKGEVITVEMVNLDKPGQDALWESMQAVLDIYLKCQTR